MELFLRSEPDSREGLLGHLHSDSGYYQICCDRCIGQGECLRCLDECVHNVRLDRGAEVLTAVLGCFGQPSRRV